MSTSPTIDSPAKPAAKLQRRTHLERTELSDRRMLDAAESLILEVGTQSTTLKAVGERAGYSRGLANSRFGNKENLFLKLAERCLAIWLDELQNAVGNKTGLAAFLTRLEAMSSYVEKYPNDAQVMYILWFESVGSSSAMKQGLARFHQQAQKDIRHLISEALAAKEVAADVDADDFAIHFTSALFGLSYQWLVNPQGSNISAQMSAIKRQMLLILRPV